MKKLLRAGILAIVLSGCGGGGGGGGGYVGAALVSIDASPTRIDPGDRTELTINLSEVDDNGIALKIRFPIALKYVSDSTTLEVDGLDDPISLTPNITTRADDFRYVVYFMRRSRFGESNQATMKLQLEGVEEASDVVVGVDPDVDDPNISNGAEFDASNPEFGAEDQVTIQVKN